MTLFGGFFNSKEDRTILNKYLDELLDLHKRKIDSLRALSGGNFEVAESAIKELGMQNKGVLSLIKKIIRKIGRESGYIGLFESISSLKDVLESQSEYLLKEKGFIAGKIMDDFRNRGRFYITFNKEVVMHEEIKKLLRTISLEEKFRIEPLTERYLQKTTEMLFGIFDVEANRQQIRRHLTASIHDRRYEDEHESITHLEYFIARDSEKVAGCIGAYSEKGDDDSCWVGWFGVDKDYRRLGLGEKLLSFVIEKARRDGKKSLKVYTSDYPAEILANEIYKKAGFEEFKREKKFGYTFFYYVLPLAGGNDLAFEANRLSKAVREGDLEQIRRLADKGADINAYDSRGMAPLHTAVFYGYKEIAGFLLSKGADINIKDKSGGRTPLHYAIAKDDMPIIIILLEKKADVNAKDRQGLTPLDWSELTIEKANKNKPDEMSDLLRRYGGRLSGKDLNSIHEAIVG